MALDLYSTVRVAAPLDGLLALHKLKVLRLPLVELSDCEVRRWPMCKVVTTCLSPRCTRAVWKMWLLLQKPYYISTHYVQQLCVRRWVGVNSHRWLMLNDMSSLQGTKAVRGGSVHIHD